MPRGVPHGIAKHERSVGTGQPKDPEGGGPPSIEAALRRRMVLEETGRFVNRNNLARPRERQMNRRTAKSANGYSGRLGYAENVVMVPLHNVVRT